MANSSDRKPPGPQQPEVNFHVAADLDYVYRDMVNVFVGAGDVVFEFGNYHRSMPGNVTISNRIVMSVAGAHDLQRRLQQVLREAQQRQQESAQQPGGEPR